MHSALLSEGKKLNQAPRMEACQFSRWGTCRRCNQPGTQKHKRRTMKPKNSCTNPEPSAKFSVLTCRPALGWSAPRLWIVTVCLAAILGFAGAVEPAHAGTINVNSFAQRGSEIGR